MNHIEELDYFTDHSVLVEPSKYFEDLRAQGPVHQLKNRDLIVVTGFDEALEVLKNTRDFSSVIAPTGPVVPLPFKPEGNDISEQIELHRSQMPAGDLVVAFDDSRHTASRAILNRLFTPSRLKANEEYMWNYAEQLIKDIVARRECELIDDVAVPYVTLVVADLLGVPDDDRELFRKAIKAAQRPGSMDAEKSLPGVPPLEYMAGFFVRYVQDRRANPRPDVLTDLATAKFPDGSEPDVMEVVRLATFLFGAGQDTSAKLIGNSMRLMLEIPGLQQKLREDRSLIPPFIEEVLRLEGSSKVTFRLTRRATKIGNMEVPAGKMVMIGLMAANRDPRRWESPSLFKLNRDKIKEHLAFGRGAHTCSGAPLARVEVRVILDRLLEHTSEIGLSEEKHGGPGNRRLAFEPSFIVRGLEAMHLEFKPR